MTARGASPRPILAASQFQEDYSSSRSSLLDIRVVTPVPDWIPMNFKWAKVQSLPQVGGSWAFAWTGAHPT